MTRALLKAAQEADGKTMEGYKGGDFLMTRGTWINRASYSCCGEKIVGATAKDGMLVLSLAEDAA